MPLIYCVEDDEGIREMISYALRVRGFQIKCFPSGEPFKQACREELPDLVLLDIMLPGESGLDILAEIRQNEKTARLPVIIMTAKTSEADIVKGLDAGADDYVRKPFGLMELISRIRSVLRRASPPEKKPQSLLTLNGVSVDTEQHRVTAEGKEVQLTKKEYKLLCYLMRNRSLVLSRNQIMQAVWGSPLDMESRTIDMHIKSLRKKLGKEGKAIHTIRGIGYRMEDHSRK